MSILSIVLEVIGLASFAGAAWGVSVPRGRRPLTSEYRSLDLVAAGLFCWLLGYLIQSGGRHF